MHSVLIVKVFCLCGNDQYEYNALALYVRAGCVCAGLVGKCDIPETPLHTHRPLRGRCVCVLLFLLGWWILEYFGMSMFYHMYRSWTHIHTHKSIYLFYLWYCTGGHVVISLIYLSLWSVIWCWRNSVSDCPQALHPGERQYHSLILWPPLQVNDSSSTLRPVYSPKLPCSVR